MKCVSADLPEATRIAARRIAAAGLSDRVSAQPIDFFADPLPRADVITMGMILHDWNLEKKRGLIRAAYQALPDGGAFVVIENLIDDARRENAFGLIPRTAAQGLRGRAMDSSFSTRPRKRSAGRPPSPR